jgi:DNA-directed RNA polymerase specialized sigma24 family protein
MRSENDLLTRLVTRARQGDQDAITELVREWHPVLLQEVRGRLGRAVRSVTDPEDVIQETWGLFFSRILPDTRLDTPAKLLAYLRITARNKAVETRRGCFRAKRDLRRSRSLGGPEATTAASVIPGREKPPDEAASLREEWMEAAIANDLPHLFVVVLLRHGYTQRRLPRCWEPAWKPSRTTWKTSAASRSRAAVPVSAVCASGSLRSYGPWGGFSRDRTFGEHAAVRG